MKHAPIKQDQAQDGHDWHSPRYVRRWIRQREYGDKDKRLKVRHRRDLACFLEAVRSRPRQQPRVLDLGCGWGRYTRALLESVPGSTAVAADYSAPMLEAAAENLSEFQSRVQFKNLDMTQTGSLDRLKGPFDVVLCVQTLHHFGAETLLEIYRQVQRALAPGGLFLNIDRVARPPFIAARLAYRLAGSLPSGSKGFDRTRVVDRAALYFDRALSILPLSASQATGDISLGRHIELMQQAGYIVDWKPVSAQRFALCGRDATALAG